MERNDDPARSLRGMYRMYRLTQLFPSDNRPVTYTDTWMRKWARSEGMSLRTLYRAEADSVKLGFVRTDKREVPDEDGRIRRRKVWTLYPLHIFTGLGEERLNALETRLTENRGKLTLEETREELENVRAYLVDVVDALTKPDLTQRDADHLYNPAIIILWHWIGKIFLGLRRHRSSEGAR